MKTPLILLMLMPLMVFKAQEKTGISNSNYSSTNSIFLNPSSSVDSRTYMQFNIIGLNAFVKTNMAYLPEFYAWNLPDADRIPSAQMSESSFTKFLSGWAGIDGPVFVISKNNYGAGLFIRARTVLNVRRIPSELTGLLFGQDITGPDEAFLNIRNAGFANMSWVEYGGNFGMMVIKGSDRMLNIGGNIRYISGINMLYAQLDELSGYYNTSEIDIDTLRGRLRYNQAAFNSGRGFGADLGITFKKLLSNADTYMAHATRSGCKYIDYRYKLAFSLRDIGYINFRKNISSYDYNTSGFYYTSPEEPVSQADLELKLIPPLITSPVKALLPSSLSGQFDYNFGYNFYLNVTAVKNLVPGTVIGVQAPDLLSVCPRFETRHVELAVPLVLHRYMYPMAGFAVRVRSLVLGVDNLLPFLFENDTYGMGVYFNLGISLFKNPACKTRSLKVDNCLPNDKRRKAVKIGLWRRIFGNQTYSK